MSVRSFKTLGASDELNRMQDNVDSILRPLLSSQIVTGNLLKDVSLISGATEVDHKLGRELVGWIVVRQDASASIWDSQTTNVRKGRTLILNSSAATTVTLWVF